MTTATPPVRRTDKLVVPGAPMRKLQPKAGNNLVPNIGFLQNLGAHEMREVCGAGKFILFYMVFFRH